MKKAIWCWPPLAVTLAGCVAELNIHSFKRTKGDNTLIGIINFSPEPQTFQLVDATAAGTYSDHFTGDSYTPAVGQALDLSPRHYLIFAN